MPNLCILFYICFMKDSLDLNDTSTSKIPVFCLRVVTYQNLSLGLLGIQICQSVWWIFLLLLKHIRYTKIMKWQCVFWHHFVPVYRRFLPIVTNYWKWLTASIEQQQRKSKFLQNYITPHAQTWSRHIIRGHQLLRCVLVCLHMVWFIMSSSTKSLSHEEYYIV
jgi:hypothetical protein